MNQKPGPLAVWLYGSVSTGRDRPSSDIDIAIVDSEDIAARQVDDPLTNQIIELADESGLHASIIYLRNNDIRRLRASGDPFWTNLEREAVPLFGPSPSSIATGGNQEGPKGE
jgi:predicted nucleotidyltransferase